MTKRNRIIAAALSALFMLTAGAVSVSAESIPDQQYEEPSYIEPQQSYEEPQQSYEEPQQSYEEPQQSYEEPQQSYEEPQQSYEEPQQSYYEEPQQSYEEPQQSYNDYSSTGEDVYYDGDGNSYSNISEMYVGGDQEYNPPASTAPSAPLFDTSKTKVDEKTLSSSDWSDIKSKLSGATKSANDDGDFGFIQNNTSTGDNGHSILIIGIAMIVLSVAGFTYLIVSGVLRRKKTALAHAGKAAADAGSNGNRYRAKDDYADDYTTSKKDKSKGGRRYR